MAENKANIPLDDFVAKVVKDPKQPPDTILLTGYLGKSSEEGHTRLYFDPELKSYVEVPNDAILHTQEISKEQASLGGSHVWIKSDAELIHGKVGPSRTKAKFFEGPIAAAAAGIGGQVGIGGGPGGSITIGPQCQIIGSVFGCPSPDPFWCPPPQTQQFTQCITPLHGCPPITPFCTQVTQCPTPLHGCPPPTKFTQCPTLFHGCPVHSIVLPCISQPIANCPALTAQCPAATAQACPSFGACPSIACGGQGGAGDPFAAHAAMPHLPTALGVVCPSHAPCPTAPPFCHTPLHGCPPLTQVCTIAVQCPTHPPALCPHTPLHGCPPPPTPLCQSVHVPCFTPNLQVCHPTSPLICHAQTPLCPTLHCQSIPVCPSAGACPSIACGGGPGGGPNQ